MSDTRELHALLDRLDALHAAATPGPWEVRLAPPFSYLVSSPTHVVCGTGDEMQQYAREDALLIAAVVNALPTLTAALRGRAAAHD